MAGQHCMGMNAAAPSTRPAQGTSQQRHSALRGTPPTTGRVCVARVANMAAETTVRQQQGVLGRWCTSTWIAGGWHSSGGGRGGTDGAVEAAAKAAARSRQVWPPCVQLLPAVERQSHT